MRCYMFSLHPGIKAAGHRRKLPKGVSKKKRDAARAAEVEARKAWRAFKGIDRDKSKPEVKEVSELFGSRRELIDKLHAKESLTNWREEMTAQDEDPLCEVIELPTEAYFGNDYYKAVCSRLRKAA